MKLTVIAIIVAGVLIGAAVLFTSGNSVAPVPANNVHMVDGKQIIEINAKGGYQPRQSMAQAGVPTVLRINTKGTFDCSSSIRIPSLGISKLLPQSGVTDIDLGVTQPGTLNGMCGMGMYRFDINFLKVNNIYSP